jgi:hypothetical protein
MWENMVTTFGPKEIAALLSSPIATNLWEHARTVYFGNAGVESLKLVFSRLAPMVSRR